MSDPDPIAAKLAELDEKYAYLHDRLKISDVERRYQRGFDRNDVELLRTAFWPDAQINYGVQANTVDEFIRGHLDAHVEMLGSWGLHITSEWVEIDGDEAHVEAYLIAVFRPKDEYRDLLVYSEGASVSAGRYIDRMQRRDGEWRILVREYSPHFQVTLKNMWDEVLVASPGWGDVQPPGDPAWPKTDRTDISYLRPMSRRPR